MNFHDNKDQCEMRAGECVVDKSAQSDSRPILVSLCADMSTEVLGKAVQDLGTYNHKSFSPAHGYDMTTSEGRESINTELEALQPDVLLVSLRNDPFAHRTLTYDGLHSYNT